MNIFDTSKTRFISHRGFTPLAPENSLPSFAYAGILGQWATETDVHVTRDGELVCCHNDTLDEYCNEGGKISDMSCAEIRRLEIVKGNRVECFESDELRIPLFSEYLAICRRFGSVPFIELKTGDTERVVSECRRCGFLDTEIVLSAIKLPWLLDSRRYAQDAFIHWIFAKEEQLSQLAEVGNAGFSYCISDPFACDEIKVAQAHRAGLKICLRAADSTESLERMKQLGLDYIPTNKMHDSVIKER
jgi:glycerophosphoryl diester phosphodiesterase